jgi:predicted membrane protein
MNTVQLIAIIVAVFFLLQVIWLTSQHKLHDQQAFMWMLFAIGALFVAFGLPYLNSLAIAIGVSYMPSLIFLVGFFVVLSLLMYHTIVFSRQQGKLINLIQEVAYLSKELEDLKSEKGFGETRSNRQVNADDLVIRENPVDLGNAESVEGLVFRQTSVSNNKDMSGERQNEHS